MRGLRGNDIGEKRSFPVLNDSHSAIKSMRYQKTKNNFQNQTGLFI